MAVKNRMIWVLLLLVLAGCLYACGRKQADPSPYSEDQFDQTGTIVLSIEHTQYDKSVTSFNYFVENNGEDPITFGAPYEIERYRNGVWESLPPAEDAAWNDIAYVVAPGEKWGNAFSFFPYDYTVTDGRYRLIKEIGGKLYRAEFTIGASDITADSPYGYESLEKLPRTLDLSTLECDLIVDAAGTITGGSEERVEDFLEQVSLGTPAMLRMVCCTIEGNPILYDIIYENNHFLLRRDATRDQPEGEAEIVQRRYSFLVTDGENIYLSDYATLDQEAMGGRSISAGRCAVFSRSWFTRWDSLAGQVEEMTNARLEGNTTLARFWNDEGTYWVNLTASPLDYTVSSRTYGMSRTLSGWEGDDGEEVEIVTVRWEDEHIVRLLGRSQGAGDGQMGYYAVFDVQEEAVTSMGRSFWQSEAENDI